MFDLTGKKALVTGSTQGIGFAIAKCLSKHGAKVFVHGSSSIEKCKKASAQIEDSDYVCADLSKDDCTDKLYQKTGDVDILVLNASVQVRNSWDAITSDDFDFQMRTNFKSSFEAIQKYAKKMKENKWGRIVTVGSVQQYKPHKDMAIYAASKSAQMGLVINLAKQLAPFGITVNNLAPGVISTPRNVEALADKNYSRIVTQGIPVGYVGNAEDMIGAALLLCSEEGRYITGIDLVVDGGMKL